MRHIFFAISLLTFLTSPAWSAVSAQDMRDARDRIIERLPDIENLWNRGLTGENNEGYITARSSLRSKQINLIQAENRDRMILYTFIAEKTGTSHIEVGRERAVLLSEKAKDGLWIQKANGDWVRK